MYKSQNFNIEWRAKPHLSKAHSFYTVRFETAAFLTRSCALKLKLSRISIEGHHSQTQTDGQLRSISGQTVRDRTESVEFFFLSEDQAEKMRYVEAKSDQYERSYVCLKFNTILSRATLARFVRTLPARSSAPSDPILFQHILFFASASDLKKSSLPFFTEKFSSTWKVTSTETDILSGCEFQSCKAAV